jgi:ribosomal protein S16
MGRKKLPFYRIIAVDSRVRRDGKPLEFLGWYNPLNKETNLNAPAIKKWLSGAQPGPRQQQLQQQQQQLCCRPGDAAAVRHNICIAHFGGGC